MMKCAKVLKCRQVWVVQLMEAERREDYNVGEGEVIVYHDDSERPGRSLAVFLCLVGNHWSVLSSRVI